MKKYFKITFFLLIFAALVVYRQIKGSNDQPAIILPTNPTAQNNTQISNSPITNSPVSDTSAPAPTSVQQSTVSGKYKDGSYIGDAADAYYGNIQVQVTIANGKISDVTFLQYPNDNHTSIYINSQAMPIFKSEAIQAQSAQVDAVSGASESSPAFQKSLSSALSKAS